MEKSAIFPDKGSGFIIHSLSANIADYLFEKKYISEKQVNVIVYGLEIVFSTLLSVALVCIIGIVIGDIANGVVFFFCFSSLRLRTGGFHCSSYFRCNLLFSVTCAICLYVVRMLSEVLFDKNVYLIWGCMLCLEIIYLTPVENKNKALRIKNKKKAKLKALFES